MGNFYEDNEDLRFYVERGIDWEPLVRITEQGFAFDDGFSNVAEAVEFYEDLLNLVGTFTADEIAPRARELDTQKPRLEDGEVVMPPVQEEIFEAIKELELHGMCLPRELGGMNCPVLLFNLNTEIISRADVSVVAHHGFHGGIAMAALVYSIEEGTTTFDRQTKRITSTRFQEAIQEIIAGEAWGSMDITEPDAGSDMAALRARAEQDEDGNWYVTGSKLFITSGHGRWHFVIARTEDPTGEDAFSGLKGLSMFLVPAFDLEDGRIVRKHTAIDGLEEKLGHNGSATVLIRFERAPAWLIGKRGDGFKHMLMLMNNARVGVGFESLGLCEAAYRAARKYAAERASMGKTIDRHEMIADYLDEMRTDIQGIRALAVYAGWHEEMQQKIGLRLRFDPPQDPEERANLEKQRKLYQQRARAVTPLLKYYASEKAVEMARRAIQIHGGAGYITEYGVEKLLRDAIVMPIYEGTSQIQALMAMKDNLMGVVRNPQRFFKDMARARWRSLRGQGLERRVAKLQLLKFQTLQFLLSRLAGTKLRELRHKPMSAWQAALTGWDPKRDFALAMLHAERLCRILTDVAIAEVLLEQVKQFPDREDVLVRFLERAEPRCRFLHDEITTTGLRLLRDLHGEPESAAGPEVAEAQAAK